jgi:hypothetical protein
MANTYFLPISLLPEVVYYSHPSVVVLQHVLADTLQL